MGVRPPARRGGPGRRDPSSLRARNGSRRTVDASIHGGGGARTARRGGGGDRRSSGRRIGAVVPLDRQRTVGRLRDTTWDPIGPIPISTGGRAPNPHHEAGGDVLAARAPPPPFLAVPFPDGGPQGARRPSWRGGVGLGRRVGRAGPRLAIVPEGTSAYIGQAVGADGAGAPPRGGGEGAGWLRLGVARGLQGGISTQKKIGGTFFGSVNIWLMLLKKNGPFITEKN